jgi:hypothetical protein
MQPAYFSASASNEADAEALEQAEDEQPAIVEFEVFDEALGDPVPQAANPIPAAPTTASRAAHRQPLRPILDVGPDLSSVPFGCM